MQYNMRRIPYAHCFAWRSRLYVHWAWSNPHTRTRTRTRTRTHTHPPSLFLSDANELSLDALPACVRTAELHLNGIETNLPTLTHLTADNDGVRLWNANRYVRCSLSVRVALQGCGACSVRV